MWDWLRETFIEPASKPERPASPSGQVPGVSRADKTGARNNPLASSGQQPSPPRAAVLQTALAGDLPHRLRQAALPASADVAPCDAVALDFETANASRASPCAVGLVWLRGDQVSHRAYRLVRPPDNRFDPGNIRVHGIHSGDVERQPEFPVIWAELAPLLEGKVLVAHNASFDTSVLTATLQAYGLRVPELRTACTLAAARRAWPGLPRHGLPDVAAHLGIGLQHHHALDDAEASAAIALSAARLLGLSGVTGLVEAVRSTRQWPATNARPLVAPATPRRMRPAPSIDADPSHPLHGRRVVVTGVLRSMTREEVLEAVAAVGGRTVANLSAQVDYLVTGSDPGWSKVSRARELQAAGARLQVIDESRLLGLLKHTTA
jgi:DNA polymerase III subunit epsilon